jgi:hypothetical protein
VCGDEKTPPTRNLLINSKHILRIVGGKSRSPSAAEPQLSQAERFADLAAGK